MFTALSPARRRLVLVLVAAVVAALAFVTVVVVRGLTSTTEPVAQDRPGPVLLVPGYGGGTQGLNELAERLRQSGKDATVVPLPGDGTGDLKAQAATLQGAVEAALRRTGAASVDVVGYSAGGIVTRLWVRDLGGDSVARRVITLGSPHHGTDLAGLATQVAGTACPTACQQLAPDSTLLQQLNAGDETPAGPSFVSIWTDRDQTVVPPSSAQLDGATDIVVQDVCADITAGHGQLVTDARIAAMVAIELSAEPVRRLTSADCSSL